MPESITIIFSFLFNWRKKSVNLIINNLIYTDIARTFNIKNIKNRSELSAVWDSVTEAYNKATNRSYAKKQLQKRLTNISYKQRKQEEKLRETTESNREVTQLATTVWSIWNFVGLNIYFMLFWQTALTLLLLSGWSVKKYKVYTSGKHLAYLEKKIAVHLMVLFYQILILNPDSF